VEKDELLSSLCSSVVFGVHIAVFVIGWLYGVNQENVVDR
jgi:hypothetical protein